jgi:hypothetical protein
LKDTEPKTVLVAQCSNCAQWRHTADVGGHATASNVGFCGMGLFPPQGEPRCDRYQISHAFRQQIISTMMKEQGPMAMPVKLVGGRQSAKKMQKKGRR